MSTIAESLAAADASWRAGDLPRAEAFFRQALELGAESAELCNDLGIVLASQGKFVEAAASFRRAAEINPSFAEAHNTLGAVLGAMGKLDEAADSCQRALQLRPELAEAHLNLGTIRARQRKFAAAMASYRRALELRPQMAEAYNNLANAAIELGDIEEAVTCSRRAIALKSQFAEAHNTLAMALVEQGRLDEAAANCRRALELKPNFAEAHSNLGAVLEKQGRLDEAAASCRRALQWNPDLAKAHNNLGAILEDPEQAAACCRRALELQPDFADASRNLGAILARQGKVDEARECYAQAMAFASGPDEWRLSSASLCPTVFDSSEEISRYRAELLGELEELAARKATFELRALERSECRPSFNLQFHGLDNRPIREAYARIFADMFPRETPPGSGGRPRIGFVVTDRHEKGFAKSTAGALQRIDQERFELVVIGSRRGLAVLDAAIGSSEVRRLEIPSRLRQAAETIRAARCDLLHYWEIGTDGMNYFLPFLRLAPVQCTCWGMQDTSGIPQVDYYLSSELIEPADAAAHYSERLIRSSTLLTYRERVVPPEVPKSRESFGLTGRQHVYLCAQQLGKFHPEFDSILAEILRRDALGVIVIPEDRQGGFVGGQLRRRFVATLGDVADRIVFVPFQPAADYLSLIAAADVLLDPPHFNGAATTYDGLSLCKPIVTLPGRFARGRYTLACYRKMGISDCVASDPAHYVELAVALGTDASLRAEVADRIRQTCAVLFDDREAVREHERIFGELVEQTRSGGRAGMA